MSSSIYLTNRRHWLTVGVVTGSTRILIRSTIYSGFNKQYEKRAISLCLWYGTEHISFRWDAVVFDYGHEDCSYPVHERHDGSLTLSLKREIAPSLKIKRAAKCTSCTTSYIKMLNTSRFNLSVGLIACSNCDLYGLIVRNAVSKHGTRLLVKFPVLDFRGSLDYTDCAENSL